MIPHASGANKTSDDIHSMHGARRSPQAINLFCLPYAGASVYSYRNIKNLLAGKIGVIPIELPGRGNRISEPLLKDIHAMADDIFLQMENRLNTPYAIYGHSIGAILGYLLVKRIIHEKLPQPLHLFFTGHGGPSVREKIPHIHSLPKKEFIEKLMEYEGSPREVLHDNDAMEFFEPMLRADFKAIETYAYEKGDPFDVPITVMTGTHEKISDEEIAKWQDETLQKISTRRFPGGHFFIFQHLPEICRIIQQTLSP